MRFQTAVGVFSICLAITNFSWSLDAGQKFHRVESDNGEVLCGMSPPNTTLNGVRSPLECVSLCRQGCASLCQSVNYRKNAKLCEQFDYRPCSYAVQPDCTNYQVTTDRCISMLKRKRKAVRFKLALIIKTLSVCVS